MFSINILGCPGNPCVFILFRDGRGILDSGFLRKVEVSSLISDANELKDGFAKEDFVSATILRFPSGPLWPFAFLRVHPRSFAFIRVLRIHPLYPLYPRSSAFIRVHPATLRLKPVYGP